MFITVEGVPDKTHIMMWLAERIRRTGGRDVLVLTFPSCVIDKAMPHAIEEAPDFPITPAALAAADYYSHAALIRCNLRGGGVVIAERWAATSIVYGITHGVDREWLELLYHDLPTADLNILLDADDVHFASNYRALWKDYAARNPRAWQVVNAREPCHSQVWSVVNIEFQRAAF